MFVKLLRFIIGYVEFTVSGTFPERFLNLNGKVGAPLWDVKRENDLIVAKTRAKDYRKLRYPAKKAGVRLKMIKKSGVPFHTNKYRKRWGLIAGPAVFFLILYILSLFVWAVDIENTSANVSTDFLRERLRIYGVRPGVLRSSIDAEKISEQLMLENYSLSWLAVNTGGSRIVVDVRGRTYAPILPDKTPCNITAKRDGQIVSVEVSNGNAVIEPDKAVKAGDLLISGVIDTQSGTITLPAEGIVCARTDSAIKVTVPFRRTEKTASGRSVRLRSIEIFGNEIPLYIKRPEGEFETHYSESKLEIFGYPLEIIKRNLYMVELLDTEFELSEEEARSEALMQLDELEHIEIFGAVVESRDDTVTVNEDSITIERKLICIENIAQATPLNIINNG